jgi:exoribonuclease R
MAVADALVTAGTGLFRVMPAPDDRAVTRLRHTAAALGLAWPAEQTLDTFARSLSGADPAPAAFMLALRRASPGAGYAPFQPGERPWHAAVAATYAHATAPLRRLADRYVVQAALSVANGNPVSETVAQAFERLPPVMARADAIAGRINRAVIDLAEAVVLAPRVGERFSAVVIDADDEGARIQLCDIAVAARLPERGLRPARR